MRLLAQIAADLRSIADEMSTGNTIPRAGYMSVYDLQPLGYTKIGSVESFRDELSAASNSDALAARFLSTLPHWWYVQDAEDYVQMSPEQMSVQEFNCGNARFSSATMGSSTENDSMWRTFVPAINRVYDENTMSFRDTPILHNGQPVYAVPNDSRAGRSVTSRVLKKNPRVADMGMVVRNAYAYFRARNENSTRPMSDIPSAFKK